MINPSKFIGRRAHPCRRCKSEFHFVNKMGGIQCERCSASSIRESDVVLRLRIDGGLWQDQSVERFDFVDSPNGIPHSETPPVAMKPSNSSKASSVAASHKEEERKEKEKSVYVPDWMRGPSGELSAREVDLFLSDLIWDQPDQLIVLKPKKRAQADVEDAHLRKVSARSAEGIHAAMEGRVVSRCVPIPDSQRKPIPTIGSEVHIKSRIRTFGGTVPPGAAVVCGAGYDSLGNVVVNLERGGAVVLSGLEYGVVE